MKTDNTSRPNPPSVSSPSAGASGAARIERNAPTAAPQAAPQVTPARDPFANAVRPTTNAPTEPARQGIQRDIALGQNAQSSTAATAQSARTRTANMPEPSTGATPPDFVGDTRPSSALAQSIQGGNNLRRGAEGPAVRDLQQALNQAGARPSVGVDGDFGPRTQEAVRSFQRQHGLDADGVVGPRTFEALQRANGGQPPAPNTPAPNTPAPNVPAPAPNTPAPDASGFVTGNGRVSSGWGDTSAQRTQQAEALLRANGQWPPQNGRAYAIQIDQDAPSASASQTARNNFARSYSGETSVFRAENGRLVEVSGDPMRSASHPGQFRSSASPDVNGDGRGDVAHIRPGVYDYNTRTGGKGGNRYNPVDDGQFRNSARDTNGDGVIDGGEADRRYSASAIQIHMGNSNSPSSIGCQTMPPADYSRFQRALRDANTGGQGSFTYILARRPNDTHGANPY